MSILDHFPDELPEPRSQQIEALEFVERTLKDNYNTVLIESPTGSGKSGIAMTASRAYGGAHICVPRVGLQQQIIDDFGDTAPLLGRSRFPCLKLDSDAHKSIEMIKRGEIPERPMMELSCAAGPCLGKPRTKSEKIKAECEALGGCPHQHSIDKCCESETVVSNLHSLLYCVSINEKVPRKPLLILDESHNLEYSLRDFLKVKIKVRRNVLDSEIKDLKTTEQWSTFLTLPEQLALLTNSEAKDNYLMRIEKLQKMGRTVQHKWRDEKTKSLFIEFTPTYVGGAAQNLLFSLADKVIMLSGTFLDKNMVVRPLGIDPEQTAFMRIESDFPIERRKVYLPNFDNLDMSYKSWGQNIDRAVKEIVRILDKHEDVKGLIHTNSYRASNQIAEMLDSERIIVHSSEDFQEKLREFYLSKEPKVFVSPTVAEGYDFKNDFARFQIIVSPAHASIKDEYVKYLLDNGGWQSYNYETLKTLMQQIGRTTRSKVDYSETYLLDSRFYGFLKKVWKLIPSWQRKAIVNET